MISPATLTVYWPHDELMYLRQSPHYPATEWKNTHGIGHRDRVL